jgi:hypothetical protein
VRLLLEHGAEVKGIPACFRLERPIDAAASEGHEGVVKVLLEHGVKFKVPKEKRRKLDIITP